MGYKLGYDTTWERDIGYGVPCKCDHPKCNTIINRGLAYVCCNQQPYGGDRGCGLYFCDEHQNLNGNHYNLCYRCLIRRKPFKPKADIKQWIEHKLTDPSWEKWRENNLDFVRQNSEVKNER